MVVASSLLFIGHWELIIEEMSLLTLLFGFTCGGIANGANNILSRDQDIYIYICVR